MAQPGARTRAAAAVKIWLPNDRVRSQDMQAGIRYELLQLARRVLRAEKSKSCHPDIAHRLAPIRLTLISLAEHWWQSRSVHGHQNGVFEFHGELEQTLRIADALRDSEQVNLMAALRDLGGQ